VPRRAELARTLKPSYFPRAMMPVGLSHRIVWRSVVALVLLAGPVGCSGSAMLRAAHQGDRAALGRAIAVADARGRLSLGEAANVARAVATRELEDAPTPAYAVSRIRDVRACAFEVDDALRDRMERNDAAAGEAALERVEAGSLSEGAAREYATSADDRFRAVGIWGMTRSGDREIRLRGLVDGSLLVRRAALHAVATRDDPAEESSVLEVARLDPDPLMRATAVRTLSRMPGAPVDIAFRLRDLWTTADDGLREDIASTFASPGVVTRGGREALAHLLAVSSGNDAVSVAGVIAGSNIDDPALRADAVAQLALALKGAGHRARIHAIVVAPLLAREKAGREGETKIILSALRDASHAEDIDVRLAALARLSDPHGGAAEGDRTASIAALETLAVPGEPSPLRSSRARFALAEVGDLRVQAWIEQDLKSPDREVRLGAADALALLGRVSRAAPLLADEDPSVRTRAACKILLAARLH
jgi:hypothetical protein